VLGIACSRIAERFSRPTVVFTTGTNPARGSARSSADINLLKVLDRCSELLVRFGGHPMAAGLSIEAARIPEFSKRFAEACRELATEVQPEQLLLDGIAHFTDLSGPVVEELSRCEPFGTGNAEPVFACAKARVVDRRIVGQGHVKFRLEQGGKIMSAIGFRMADHPAATLSHIAIAFTPQLNIWNGTTSVQLKLTALAPADPDVTAAL
jgi:single-stranded-DNA-specific exonuclease